jgi:hypothetical protein
MTSRISAKAKANWVHYWKRAYNNDSEWVKQMYYYHFHEAPTKTNLFSALLYPYSKFHLLLARLLLGDLLDQ